MSDKAFSFTITKGFENTFIFTIKADNSTLPMPINVGDTFSASLFHYDPALGSTPVHTWNMTTFGDPNNGKVELSIPAVNTNSLTSERGDKVDRFYLKPTYRLVINCSTSVNGDFLVKVPEVYVD